MYLKNSDRCMKFFHELVKQNNKHNTIVAITKTFGEHTTNIADVATEFVAYFQNLLGTAMYCNDHDLDANKLRSGLVITEAQ